MKFRFLNLLLSALSAVVGVSATETFPPPAAPVTRPEVIKHVKTLPFVSVAGGVLRPQRLTWAAGMTVLSSISAAGGLSEYAKGDGRLVRDGKMITKFSIKKIQGKKAVDPELKPGDQVTVIE